MFAKFTHRWEEFGLMMKFLFGMITAIALLAIVAWGTIRTGGYNVAATDPHADVMRWALKTNMENSVEGNAQSVVVPAGFSTADPETGFSSFDAMCVHCHGGPGIERAEWAKGLLPKPPSLSEAAGKWNSAEIFWIVRNGIKLTGMPAIGDTHADEDIWKIVSFVERLPDMKPERYAVLRKEKAEEGGGHHGSPAGSDKEQSQAEEGGEGHHEDGSNAHSSE